MSNITSSNFPAKKHIHILGAAGSGTTTLATYVSNIVSYQHFDSDNFFWKVKYTEKQTPATCLNNLKSELENFEQWILSGAIIDWGNPLIPLFDLVVFVSVSNEVRLQRLNKREFERYGEAISPQGNKFNDHQEFMSWADEYETGGMEVRSRLQQNMWLKELNCPILRINGDDEIEQNVNIIVDNITSSESAKT